MRYIFTLCCAFVMTMVVGQEVLSSTYLKSYEKSFFTGNFGLFSSFDVSLYHGVVDNVFIPPSNDAELSIQAFFEYWSSSPAT